MTGRAPGGRVCVVGSLNIDLVVRCPRLPIAGETILGSGLETLPGGKGANQAVAAARSGARVAMIGAVGRDAYGDRLHAVIAAEGIDAGRLRRVDDRPTGVAIITVADDGENTIVVAPGANHALARGDISDAVDAIRGADVLLLQLESPVAVVAAALDAAIADGQRVRTLLNAAPAQTLPQAILRRVDVLVVNQTEAATLIGGAVDMDGETMALDLSKLGPPMVVLTLGSEGAIAVVREGEVARHWRMPSYRVDPIDTVGAGDAFVGAMAAALAKGRPFDDALEAAAAAGALATTRRGAIPSLPAENEIADLRRAQPRIRARADSGA